MRSVLEVVRPLARIAVVLAAVGACSGTPGGDGGADASIDAGLDAHARDAGRDAGRDVGTDASRSPDTNTDAGFCDPGWVRFPDMPDACYVEYASHPECVLSMTWDTCFDFIPGPCTSAWIDSNTGLQFYYQHDGAFWDPVRARGVVLVAAQTPVGFAPLIDYRVLVATDGTVVAAVRSTMAEAWLRDGVLCPGHAAAAPDAVVASNEFDDFGPTAAPPYPVHMFRGGYSDWWSHPLPVTIFDSLHADEASENLTTSSTVTVAEITPADYLLIWRGGDPRRLQRPGSLSPQRIVGDDLFYEDYCGTADCNTRIYRSGADDTDELLIDGVPGTDIRNFTTDGVNMAWFLATSFDASGVPSGGEIVVSPYALHAADVHPRTLRSGLLDSQGFHPVLGPDAIGYAYEIPASPHYQSILDLLSLADGSRSRITLPNSGVPLLIHFDSNPLWVSDDEVAVIIGAAEPDTGLFRFSRSAFTPAP